MKNKLKLIRAHKNLTQEQLADLAGISRPALAQIENENTEPDGETIVKLVNALHVSADDIFEGLGVLNEADKMSKRSRVSGFYISPRSAMIIVSALSKVAVEGLTEEMRSEEPWKAKHLYINLIDNFANAAAMMLKDENPFGGFICQKNDH